MVDDDERFAHWQRMARERQRDRHQDDRPRDLQVRFGAMGERGETICYVRCVCGERGIFEQHGEIVWQRVDSWLLQRTVLDCPKHGPVPVDEDAIRTALQATRRDGRPRTIRIKPVS